MPSELNRTLLHKVWKLYADGDMAQDALLDIFEDTIDPAVEELKKQAKEIILSLYNAGRDVLMCRSEELAYERLDKAINDKRIEQFLEEVKHA